MREQRKEVKRKQKSPKEKADFKVIILKDDGGIETIERDVGLKWWWGCIVASTTQIKHGFMRRPSLQDSQQLEKPHLLPWSGARATARTV